MSHAVNAPVPHVFHVDRGTGQAWILSNEGQIEPMYGVHGTIPDGVHGDVTVITKEPDKWAATPAKEAATNAMALTTTREGAESFIGRTFYTRFYDNRNRIPDDYLGIVKSTSIKSQGVGDCGTVSSPTETRASCAQRS